MRNWKDIQDQIRSAEEPLSPNAWKDMRAKLSHGQRGKLGWVMGLLVLVGILAGWVVLSNTEFSKQYYQPREMSGGADRELPAGQFRQDKRPADEPAEIQISENEPEEQDKKIASGASTDRLPDNERAAAVAMRPETEKLSTPDRVENVGAEKPLSIAGKEAVVESPVASSLIVDTLMGEMKKEFSTGLGREDIPRLELRVFMGSTYNIPSLEYRHAGAQTHRQFEEAVEDAVKPGWGLDAGFEIRYRLFRNFRISTGVSYREIVTQNNYDYEVSEVPVIDSASGNIVGYIPASRPQKRVETSRNTYGFFNVPLSLYYEQPLGGRWSLTGEAINNISFLIRQEGYGIDPTTLELEKSRDDIFNSIINSYQFRLGLRYRVRDNFYLALEPAYRSYYQDFFKDENISWKPRDFSVGLSAIIRLSNPKTSVK